MQTEIVFWVLIAIGCAAVALPVFWFGRMWERYSLFGPEPDEEPDASPMWSSEGEVDAWAQTADPNVMGIGDFVPDPRDSETEAQRMARVTREMVDEIEPPLRDPPYGKAFRPLPPGPTPGTLHMLRAMERARDEIDAMTAIPPDMLGSNHDDWKARQREALAAARASSGRNLAELVGKPLATLSDHEQAMLAEANEQVAIAKLDEITGVAPMGPTAESEPSRRVVFGRGPGELDVDHIRQNR